MAQIIKMDGGGTQPTVASTQIKPNRSFKWDGQAIDVTNPQFDKDFREILNSRNISAEVGDRVMHYYNQILNGTGDITGEYTSGKWTGLDAGDEQIQNKLANPRGGTRRKFRNDRQALYELGEAMKEYAGRKPKETITKNDYSWDKAWTFDYDTEGEGDQQTRKFRATTGYANLLALLDGILKIPDMAEDQYYNDRKEMDYRTAKNWVNQYKDKIAGIKERVMNGTWTDQDKTAIEAWTGKWNPDKKTGSSSDADDSKETVALKKKFKDAGWDYDTFKDLIAIDNDGNAKITNQNLLKFVTDAGVTDNYWLNDSFNDYTSNAFSKYIPQGKGIFVYGGNAYLGDSEKLKQIKMFQDFIAENKATGGNATGTKQWWVNGVNSGLSDLNATANGEQLYSPAFTEGTNFGRDVTGDYMNRPKNALIYEYIPGYTTDNAELFDEYGRPLDSKRQLIFIDPITKQPIQVTPEEMAAMQKQTNQKAVNDYYADPNRRTAFSKYYIYGANDPKNQRKFIQVGGLSDPNNPGSGIIVLYDTDNKKYYLRDENPINGAWGNINHRKMDVKAKNYMFDIPDEIGAYIANGNPMTREDYEILEANIANMYRQNGTLMTKFYRANNAVSSELLQSLINTYYLNDGALYKRGSRSNSLNTNQAGSKERLWILPWELLQLNQPATSTDQQVVSNKNGGILKAASGQKVRETTKSSQDAVQKSDTPMRKSGQERVIGDGSGSTRPLGLTNSDYWELGSLVADGASLVASLVPVYSAIGAGLGVASSITNFGADVARDGLDWGDAKALAVNLGLDVATLFGGAAGKSMKIVKRLKDSKAIKWLIDHPKLLGAASATVNSLPIYDAIKTSYDKIQNGKWTINDIRTIVQGLRGVTNFAKTKGSAKTTKELDTATLNAPKGSNLPSVKLTTSEIESVSNAAKGESKNVLNGILKEKLKWQKMPDGSAIPDDFDFAKAYGVKTSGVDINWKKLWKSKKGNNINTNQFELDTETVYRNPNEMNWWNWNRRAAIRDAKQNVDNPYFMGTVARGPWPVREPNGRFRKREVISTSKPIADPVYGYDYRADLTPGLDSYTEENQPIYYQAYNTGGKLPDLSIVSSMLDSYKKGGIIKATSGTKAYGNKGTETETTEQGWSNSDTNNVIDLVKLATELGSINKSNKIALDGVEKAKNYIRSQQSPIINKENLNLNPIHRGAEMQRDNLNKARVVGSDSRINNAQQLAIQDRINEITDKENYAVSNAIAQNGAMNRKIDSANASVRTQMNNQIALQLANAANSEANAKNTGLAQKNGALQSYLIGLQTRIDKDQMAQASMRDVVAKMNAQQQRKTAIYSKWGKEWADLSKEDKEKYGDDIDKYVQTKYPNEYSNIYTKSIYDYYNNSRPRNNSRMTVQDFGDLGLSAVPDQVDTEPEVKKIRFGITSSKNGSKMRPVSDQLILDTNKEAAKVINKLSDNAVKFLLKAIK